MRLCSTASNTNIINTNAGKILVETKAPLLFYKPAFNSDWLFYYELRNFAAFNKADKIIYYATEG